MTLPKLLTLLLLTILFISCSNERNNETALQETADLEYAVFNQTLHLIDKVTLFTNPRTPKLPKKFQLEAFESKFNGVSKTKLYNRIKKEGIDTSITPIYDIDFLILPDSLTKTTSSNSKALDLKRINHSTEIVLIREDDAINNSNLFIKSIELSRINFNKSKNKAEFKIGIIEGYGSATGYKINCEFKNGAWVIVKTTMLWVT